MPSRVLDFPVFDVDNHMYETTDAFTKFLPTEYEGLIKFVDVQGRTKIAIRNVISDYIPNPTFEVVAAPGAQEQYFKQGNPEGKSRREIMGKPIRSIPAYRDPEPRLQLMDELGIDRALMWPTLASLLEERLGDDPLVTHAVIHALNQWMHEHWTFNYQERIFPAPVVTLCVVDRAIEELDWVLERGARVILIRPAPVPGFMGRRSMALPEFDPFWSRVVESGIFVGMHGSDSGYQRYQNEWEGVRSGEMLPFRDKSAILDDPLPHAPADHGHDRLTDRARTVQPFPRSSDRSCREREQLGALPPRRVGPCLREWPRTSSTKIRSRCSDATSTSTLSTRRIRSDWSSILGADRVLFGSDYPHPEGMSDPISFVDQLKGLDESAIRKVMGGNLAGLMHVSDAA